jgi:hypothetical protein
LIGLIQGARTSSFLQTFGDDMLRPAVVRAAVDGVLERISEPVPANDLVRLHDAQRAVSLEIERLMLAIAASGDLPSPVDALKKRQSMGSSWTSRSRVRPTSSHYMDRGADGGDGIIAVAASLESPQIEGSDRLHSATGGRQAWFGSNGIRYRRRSAKRCDALPAMSVEDECPKRSEGIVPKGPRQVPVA